MEISNTIGVDLVRNIETKFAIAAVVAATLGLSSVAYSLKTVA